MDFETIAFTLSIFAILFSGYAVYKVAYIVAAIDFLTKAPVLRQYVERVIPLDNSEDAKKELEQKRALAEKEFYKTYGISGDDLSKVKLGNGIPVEDTV